LPSLLRLPDASSPSPRSPDLNNNNDDDAGLGDTERDLYAPRKVRVAFHEDTKDRDRDLEAHGFADDEDDGTPDRASSSTPSSRDVLQSSAGASLLAPRDSVMFSGQPRQSLSVVAGKRLRLKRTLSRFLDKAGGAPTSEGHRSRLAASIHVSWEHWKQTALGSDSSPRLV
jgi:hypothetical protein